MTQAEPPDAGMHKGAEALAQAEKLLLRSEEDPTAASDAAVAALRALLLAWAQTPRGDQVGDLLRQAAETDETLSQFRSDAAALDEGPPGLDSHERAKVFVDAARGRLANI